MDSSSTSSSSAKKNKLDEDAKTYCDILAKCSLPDVAKWKEEDLERAFRWSSYFKQVHSRCMHRASLMEKFDIRFREIGHSGGWRFAGEPVSCAFLGTSHHYLAKALLENPALPVCLREKVLHRYVESEGIEAKEALLKHLNELDSCRGLLETLQAVHTKMKEHVAYHSGCTQQPGLISVDATCLLADIHWLLSLRQEKHESNAVVHKKLGSLVHETKGGLDVVLHSLITSPGDSSGGAQEIKSEDIKRVILDWLLQQLNDKMGVGFGSKLNNLQQRLLKDCPPNLLVRVSSVYTVFFREYIKLLMTKAEEIEQSRMHDIINSNAQAVAPDRDKPTCTPMEIDSNKDLAKETSEFELLLEHFKTLTQSGGGKIKEVCVSLLKVKLLPPIAEKCHLPPMVGTIWNKILHAVLIDTII